jgi:hypothetical protein
VGWPRRRTRELSAITAPTAVRVQGRVADGSRVRSPFTDVEARLFGWKFFVNTQPTLAGHTTRVFGHLLDRSSTDALNREPSLAPAGGFLFAEALHIDVGGVIVEVPTLGLDVHFRSRAFDPTPVDRPWPDFIPATAQAGRGVIYFVEHMLIADDVVELVGTVGPVSRGDGAYRGAATAHFIARADLEPVVLHELDPASR